METKELMIGDIVYYNESIVKVTSLNPIVVGFAYCDTNEGDASTDMCIEHIPLTEEILLANGFRKQEWSNGDIMLYGKPSYYDYLEPEGCAKYFFVRHRFNRGWFVYNNTNIQTNEIHTFQHALRLCGLNDLADNFKIPNV